MFGHGNLTGHGNLITSSNLRPSNNLIKKCWFYADTKFHRRHKPDTFKRSHWDPSNATHLNEHFGEKLSSSKYSCWNSVNLLGSQWLRLNVSFLWVFFFRSEYANGISRLISYAIKEFRDTFRCFIIRGEKIFPNLVQSSQIWIVVTLLLPNVLS